MHAHGVVPRLDADVFDAARRSGDASVVEHDVQPAEVFQRCSHRAVDVGLAGYVRGDEAGALPQFLGQALAAQLVDVGQDDNCALGGE